MSDSSNLTLGAGKYLLVNLEDLNFVTKMNEVQKDLYIEISGPDRQWLVDVAFDKKMHFETLPNGNIRACYRNPQVPRMFLDAQMTKAVQSLHDHGKTAYMTCASYRWVGSAFDGREKDGIVEAIDGHANKKMWVFELDKDSKVEVSTDSKGLTGIQIGTAKAKKPTVRKRNSKGHYEKSEPVATAK